MNAKQQLEREYLEMRARILELAACMDRLDRAEGGDSIASDPAHQRLVQAMNIVIDSKPDRAERVQLLFSRAYESDWQQKFAATIAPATAPKN